MTHYADAHNHRGVAYGNRGVLDRAAEQLRLAVRLAPDSAGAHNKLAFSWEREGRRPGRRKIREWRQPCPGNAEVFNSEGIVYVDLGPRAEAAEAFRKGASLKPDDPRCLTNLYRLKLRGV